MNQLWACEETYIRGHLERVLNAKYDEKAISAFSLLAPDKKILSIDGDTARIAVTGLLKRGGASPIEKFLGIDITSYEAIQEAIQKVDAAKAIKNVIYDINSPGGDVDGADETGQMITALAKKKSTIAINHGIMASAALWMGSQAGRIEASAPTALTGAIGIVIIAVDRDGDLNENGFVRVKVVSRNAPKKSPDLATEEGKAVLEERANALERVFISRIAAGRRVTEEKVIADFGQGDVLIAQDPDAEKPDAISVGMIDGLVAGSISAKRGQGERATALDDNKILIDKYKTKIQKQKGNNAPKKGNAKMSLRDQILALDASLVADFDKEISTAREAGKADERARVAPAIPVLESTKYGQAIKNIAVEVLKGEESSATLKATMAAYDALKEGQSQGEANTETGEQGGTPPDPPATPPLVNEDGTVADEKALMELTLKAQGRSTESEVQ